MSDFRSFTQSGRLALLAEHDATMRRLEANRHRSAWTGTDPYVEGARLITEQAAERQRYARRAEDDEDPGGIYADGAALLAKGPVLPDVSWLEPVTGDPYQNARALMADMVTDVPDPDDWVEDDDA